MNEPLVFAFPGVKVAKLTDYPYFSGRKVLLSVGLRGPEAFDGNVTEAQVRDLCLAEARVALAEFKGEAEWFDVRKEGTETTITRNDGDFSLPESLDFSDLADRSVMLKLGRTNDGGYAVIIGGIINAEGKMESHGRWLPYPILVPMMVGTAMSLRKIITLPILHLKLVDCPKKPYKVITHQKKEFVRFIGLLINLPVR